MNRYNKELDPVSYNTASIRILKFQWQEYQTCFSLHWHERLEIVRVREGEMYVGHGKNTISLHSGDLFLILPRMPHQGYTLDSSVQYDVLMFDIRSFYNDTELCKTFFPAILDKRAKFEPVITDADTLSCFDSILDTEQNISLKTVAELYRFLSLLFSKHLLELRDELSEDDTILNMMQYMEENFQKSLSTNELAAHFGYTPEYFCRKFKQATGLTPNTYLRVYRLEQALELLMHEHGNIREIAEYCGFDDPNYFTRCFKAHYGMSPTRFRKN